MYSRKTVKKVIAAILAIIMIGAITLTAFASQPVYTITNPYANVDFSQVNAYKTALHTHTNASDGDPTLKESLKRHADAGFDIVAVTDHGTVNYTWVDENPNKLIHGALSLVGKSEGKLEYLGTSGAFTDGTDYSVVKNESGDEILRTATGKNVLRLPYGIENNAVSVNAHVNSWFADYSDNTVTTYEDAVKGVEKAKGVSVINHPGEYTKARYELHTADAYNEENAAYAYYINKFAGLINKYDSCIGIDINSKGDNRTRFDRKLWDNLLTRFSANGKNVFAIASSDAHALSVIDTGYSLLLMPELTSAAARNSLEKGEFFAASHCLGNYEELCEIATAIKSFYGETDVYSKVNSTAEEIAKKVEAIESGKLAADESIGITYSVLDDNGVCTASTHPEITNISVENDTIKIGTENALIVRFISDGRLIKTAKAGEATFSLSENADKIGDYIRAEVFGEGGMLYTQAFLVNAQEKTDNGVIKGVYINLGVLDFLLAEFSKWVAIIGRFMSNLV